MLREDPCEEPVGAVAEPVTAAGNVELAGKFGLVVAITGTDEEYDENIPDMELVTGEGVLEVGSVCEGEDCAGEDINAGDVKAGDVKAEDIKAADVGIMDGELETGVDGCTGIEVVDGGPLVGAEEVIDDCNGGNAWGATGGCSILEV